MSKIPVTTIPQFAFIPAAELVELVRSTVTCAFADALIELRTSSSSTWQEPQQLTIKEAAERLRCSLRTVRRLINKGRLRSTRLTLAGGSRVLIASESVDKLLEGLGPYGLEGDAL